MGTTRKAAVADRSGAKALAYVGTNPKKVLVAVGVSTPQQIFRSLKLSSSELFHLRRAMAAAGVLPKGFPSSSKKRGRARKA